MPVHCILKSSAVIDEYEKAGNDQYKQYLIIDISIHFKVNLFTGIRREETKYDKNDEEASEEFGRCQESVNFNTCCLAIFFEH